MFCCLVTILASLLVLIVGWFPVVFVFGLIAWFGSVGFCVCYFVNFECLLNVNLYRQGRVLLVFGFLWFFTVGFSDCLRCFGCFTWYLVIELLCGVVSFRWPWWFIVVCFVLFAVWVCFACCDSFTLVV